MAYFAASLIFLLAGLGSMASGFGLVTAGVDAPETLAVVHMAAIGWLGLLFRGALLQFVPVPTATHLRLAWVAAPALGIIVCGLYVHDVLRMLKARRRKGLKLNLLAGLVALAFLPVGLALLLCSQWLGKALPFGTAAFCVLAIGWLSGLGLAQLYKIIPFLTWIETYGPVMGRNAVPRVQDLVRERRAAVWFLMFNATVVLGAAAILADSGIALRVASLCQCLAVAALSIEYLRARRLTYAPEPLKLPPGTERPHLIYATIKE
jgi:hypothetical protein